MSRLHVKVKVIFSEVSRSLGKVIIEIPSPIALFSSFCLSFVTSAKA